MYRRWWMLFLGVALASQQLPALAQHEWEKPRPHWYVEGAGMVGPNFLGASAAVQRVYALFPKGRWRVGFGARINAVRTTDADFITAPAELTTEGGGGPLVLFRPTLEENLDTLTASATIFSLGATLDAEFFITPRWALGFSIDVIGFSFGPETDGTFQSSEFEPTRSTQKAKPTEFNILGTSDNDVGNLNSEFYVRYEFSERSSIRAGLGYMFNELETEQELTRENDRFRFKASAFLLGYTHILGR